MIVDWAQKRKLQRLRSDRQVGVPEKDRLKEWLAIFEARGLTNEEQSSSCSMRLARAADRCGRFAELGVDSALGRAIGGPDSV